MPMTFLQRSSNSNQAGLMLCVQRGYTQQRRGASTAAVALPMHWMVVYETHRTRGLAG